MNRPEHNQREYFRIPHPGLSCYLPHNGRRHEFPIVDMSIAGLALLLPANTQLALEDGKTYADCTFSIPEHGEIVVTLLVRNILELNAGSALSFRRAGCSFVSIKPQTQAMLMQFLAHLERENLKNAADENS